MPLVAVKVTVRARLSTSATVKSASAAAVPTVTLCALPGTPVRVGASFTAVMVTVMLPTAVNAPPVPCALIVLPSLKLQSICTLAGGVLELLA